MFLVAGLGNPGEEYALTPHNLGFLMVDRLAERHGIRVTRKDSKALVGMGEIDGQPVMLAKPQTYMNLSGTSLAPLMEKHSIELGPADSGLRRAGPALAGAEDQAERLGGGAQRNEDRDRQPGNQRDRTGAAGSSSGPSAEGRTDYLLAPFKRSQMKELDEFVDYAADAVGSIIAEGVEKAMTKFNRRAPGLNKRKHEDLRRAVHRQAGRAGRRGRRVRRAVEDAVDHAGATVDKVEKWGKRRLAYRVDKYREGAYVLFQFTARPRSVKEFERRLRVTDWCSSSSRCASTRR